jgi:hypothetical protein
MKHRGNFTFYTSVQFLFSVAAIRLASYVWKPKVNYRVHKTHHYILSLLKPNLFVNFTPYFLKILFSYYRLHPAMPSTPSGLPEATNLTGKLSTRNSVNLQRLMVTRLVKKFFVYATRRFNDLFTKANQCYHKVQWHVYC